MACTNIREPHSCAFVSTKILVYATVGRYCVLSWVGSGRGASLLIILVI